MSSKDLIAAFSAVGITDPALPSRDPISAINRIIQRHPSIKVSYDDFGGVSDETSVNTFVFRARLTVTKGNEASTEFIGSGSSKKQAKSSAADRGLQHVLRLASDPNVFSHRRTGTHLSSDLRFLRAQGFKPTFEISMDRPGLEDKHPLFSAHLFITRSDTDFHETYYSNCIIRISQTASSAIARFCQVRNLELPVTQDDTEVTTHAYDSGPF